MILKRAESFDILGRPKNLVTGVGKDKQRIGQIYTAAQQQQLSDPLEYSS